VPAAHVDEGAVAVTILEEVVAADLFSAETIAAIRRSRISRRCRFPDLPGKSKKTVPDRTTTCLGRSVAMPIPPVSDAYAWLPGRKKQVERIRSTQAITFSRSSSGRFK
jgi:hypothetical protein